jgi:UDP-glucose 4-epimerase
VKQFLVTGAAGFIGGAVASALINQGHCVVTIDNLSTGFEAGIPNGVTFIKGDCQSSKVIKQLHEYNFDAIFHIAGQSSGEISFDDPIYDLQTNTQSTLMLLDFAKQTGIKHFIYASSMSVYGNQTELPAKESAVCNPISFYAIGKLASEEYLKVYSQNYGINTAALRLFNVYGPGQNMDNLRQGMISIFLAQALQNNHILVKGSKDRFRDFVYIDDVVAAFLACLNIKGSTIYNVSTNEKHSVEFIIEAIRSHLKTNCSVTYDGVTPGDMLGILGLILCFCMDIQNGMIGNLFFKTHRSGF